ncbi:hypothetical protein LguiB_025669 [Lonicera macranthoides]
MPETSRYSTFYQLISQPREGEQIDQTLVKDITYIYIEMGEYAMKFYLEWCLKDEEERVSYYLQGSCQNKLLEVLPHKLLVVHTSKLDENKQLNDKTA